MYAAFYLLLALMGASTLHHCQACVEENSVMVATTPIQVQLADYVYNDDKQDYIKTMSAQYNQPVPPAKKTISVDLRDGPPRPAPPPQPSSGPRPPTPRPPQLNKELCLAGVPATYPCTGVYESSYSWGGRLFSRDCFDYYRQGLYKVAGDEQSTNNPDDSCDFTGFSRTWSLTKIDSQGDAVNLTFVEDREVKKCGQPAKRSTKMETVIYKVTRGCVLHARAQGCQPNTPTCHPCTSNEVVIKSNSIYFCSNKTFTCNASLAGFTGCPNGFQVAKDGFKTVDRDTKVLVCELCPPNSYQDVVDSYSGESSSGFRAKCEPCPEYQEVKHWGATDCTGCPAGQYPKNKMAPLQCTKCPPGTYSGSDSKKCTRCTGGFYADQQGMTSCKKCPTEWRCLVPNKVLGKFNTTPYRWDESGNPSCPTLDGKSCWKENPASCADKLKKMKVQLSQGTQFKALVCGPMHQKVWGFNGYNDDNHWCSITKKLFMQPGKKDVGATSCNASATMVAALPEVETEKDRCNCCDMCQSG